MTIIITVDHDNVFNALMRTTGYIGAKQLDNDKDAYRRISLTESDSKLLERFWHESCSQLCTALRRQIESEGMEGDSFRLDLNVSESFDRSLQPTLYREMNAFVMQSMATKWLAITDKEAAADYSAAATRTLEEITRQIYCKRKPRRPQLTKRAN